MVIKMHGTDENQPTKRGSAKQKRDPRILSFEASPVKPIDVSVENKKDVEVSGQNGRLNFPVAQILMTVSLDKENSPVRPINVSIENKKDVEVSDENGRLNFSVTQISMVVFLDKENSPVKDMSTIAVSVENEKDAEDTDFHNLFDFSEKLKGIVYYLL